MDLVILGVILYITFAMVFFLTMFLYVGPMRTRKMIMEIFTSTDPKDQELVRAMGGALSDVMCQYIGYLGGEFQKGNTAPLYNVVGPLLAASRGLASSMIDGAAGHIIKGSKKAAMMDGLDPEKVEFVRSRLSKKQQGWLDLFLLAKDILPGGKGAKTPPAGTGETFITPK